MTPTPLLKRTLAGDMGHSLDMALIAVLLGRLDYAILSPAFGVLAVLDAVLNFVAYKMGRYE